MTELKPIRKKDIPELLEDRLFWSQDFLSISRNRLLSQYKNPTADDDDVVLLLAYYNHEPVGYMGVFVDRILIGGKPEKIGWLSTWWVHPKTKGTGIGREILNKMYELSEGKIGISQFTPSAKRVYDKSVLFTSLKTSLGVKAVLRSNLSFVVPMLYPKMRKYSAALNVVDDFVNFFVNIKLAAQSFAVTKNLNNVTLEYLTVPDAASLALINKFNRGHISPKDAAYFEWLKAYPWVQEAPLLELTQKHRYEFSMYDEKFNLYYIKVSHHGSCIGFVVLQRRGNVAKILFSYYDTAKHAAMIADVIKLQCIRQQVREIICYDAALSKEFKDSAVFLYSKKKVKQSIISKAFGTENLDSVHMNFGDGDCCFA